MSPPKASASTSPNLRANGESRQAEFLSIAEAAEYFGVTTRTIHRYIKDGRLPASRLGPRFIRIKVADLDALLSPIPAGR